MSSSEQKFTPAVARYTIVVGTLVIIAIAVFGFFSLFRLPAHAPIEKTEQEFKTYANSTYGYSVRYPATLSIKEYTPDYVSIGTPTADDGFDATVESDVYTSEPSDASSTESFADFAHRQAENTCAADGPTASIDCPRVSRSTLMTTDSGVTGEMFYLTQATHSVAAGSVAETERGPYYAFRLSADTDSTYRVLLIRPPSATDPTMINEPVVTAVAKSLRISAP